MNEDEINEQTTDAELLRSLESDIVEFKPYVRKRLLELAARLEHSKTTLANVPLAAEEFVEWVAELLSTPNPNNKMRLTAALHTRDALLHATAQRRE